MASSNIRSIGRATQGVRLIESKAKIARFRSRGWPRRMMNAWRKRLDEKGEE
jgi:hypothetical protein